MIIEITVVTLLTFPLMIYFTFKATTDNDPDYVELWDED